MTDGRDARRPGSPREGRQERERRARRLWRHYEPPAPGDVEREVDRQQPWSAYRRREPASPTSPAAVAAAARDRAAVRAAARAADRAANQAAVDAGDKVLRNMVIKLVGFAALLGVAGAFGVFEANDEREANVKPPETPDVGGYAGPDPRTGAGLDQLSDVLDAQLGDDRVVRAELRSDGADIEILRPDGDVDAYLWHRSVPSVVVQYDTRTRRGGTLVDLDQVHAELFATSMSRLQQDVGADLREGKVVILHAEGSPAWVEITVSGERKTGVIRAALDGTVLSEQVD